ncbi:MAG: three-Cys-motif partner protein TcmP [Holophagales bacterium]|jgi:three-Cys-motif partner protein|nr:three-Cys-motif partner protein TcmP [Holophagales bacterium]
MDNQFFQEQREQSMIKARIVSKYFKRWAGVMLGTIKKYDRQAQKLAYIDLFAGPGRYDDQSKSTPILVLETILADPDLSSRMLTLFNDKDNDNIKSLKTSVALLPEVAQLKYAPIFFNEEVGDEIAQWFSQQRMVPTFFFVDPWGYKGLSRNLVSSIIKDWGCDCVFFFNYNRINMGVNNSVIEPHLLSLFGEEKLTQIREQIVNAAPDERESIIIQALCYAFKGNEQRFVLPFRFRNNEGTRTSHHLIFITKNFRGYDIMKTIMAEESSDNKDGVANFEYNPRDMRYKQGSLFDMLSRPIDDLQSMLLQEYSERTIDFMELYEKHSVDKPYIKKNYKDVLWTLYDADKITAVNPKGNPPRKGTFSDEMRITFGGAK